MDHKRRDAVSEALVNHEVSGIGQHSFMKSGDIAHQVIKAVAGHPSGGVHINAVEPLHDFRVVRNLKVRHCRFAEPLQLHICAVIRSNGHRWIDDIGNHH